MAFQEGKDFNAIADPQLASGAYYPFNGFYHTPGAATLPSTTSLQPDRRWQSIMMQFSPSSQAATSACA